MYMYEYQGTHRDGSYPNDGDLLVRPNGIIFSLEMDATHVSYKADPGILSDSCHFLFSLGRYVRVRVGDLTPQVVSKCWTYYM